MFRYKTQRPIFTRVVGIKIACRQKFFGRVDNKRKKPFAISIKNILPRHKNFVAENAETGRHAVEGVQIIGLTERDKFSQSRPRIFGQSFAAEHDFPVAFRDVAEFAIVDDNIIFAQNFGRLVRRQNVFPVRREKSAVVQKKRRGFDACVSTAKKAR